MANATFFSYAQSVTPAVVNIAGNSFQHKHYVLEWSVGEMAIINQMNSSFGNLIISNGFLQPYTHNPALINVAPAFGPEEIRILPNPTKDVVEINFLTAQKGKVSFVLADARGRIIYKKEFDSYGHGRIEHIDMRRMTGGTYFLRIELVAISGSVSKKGSYKIIKLN